MPRADRAAPPATARAAYPSVRIASGPLTASVYLPDARAGRYRGTRFDWSAMAADVRVNGHAFLGPWTDAADDPTSHDANAIGTAGEFGMDDPLGFADAEPGGTFVKVGVGVLRRPDERPYQFYRRYELVRPGTWDVTVRPDSVEFVQSLGEGPWAYRYASSVEAGRSADTGDATLVVRRVLANTGTRAIDTTHYAHNFVNVDARPVGEGFRLVLPFDAAVRQPRQLHGDATVAGDAVTFVRPIEAGRPVFVHFVNARPDDAAHHAAVVEHVPSGAAVRIAGTRPPAAYRLYAARGAICPEPFVAVRAAPGETVAWTIVYTFVAPGVR